MFAVFLPNNTLCTEQKVILKEQKRFYQELYSADKSIVFNIKNKMDVRITKEQRENLDKEVEVEEVCRVIMSLKKGKVAGCDGLPIEFYVEFCDELLPLLHAMYINTFDRGIMNLSMQRGVIMLIPKKEKDMRYIKNMHPLTLLNIDYKILAKLLADKCV